MTQNLSAKLTPLTIVSGQTSTRWVSSDEYGDADVILLYGPASLDAIAFTIEVAADRSSQVAKTLQSGGVDVLPPGAGAAEAYFDLPTAGAFRITAASGVGANRTWEATKQFKG